MVMMVVVIGVGSSWAGEYQINQFEVYSGTGGQSHPVIDGDIVVWIDAEFGNGPSGPVHYKNLSSGQDVIIVAIKDHLEQLQFAGSKRSDRTSKIKTPGSDK